MTYVLGIREALIIANVYATNFLMGYSYYCHLKGQTSKSVEKSCAAYKQFILPENVQPYSTQHTTAQIGYLRE